MGAGRLICNRGEVSINRTRSRDASEAHPGDLGVGDLRNDRWSLQILSIIICTKDRVDSLRATLAAVVQCEIPRNTEVELLIVDNSVSATARQAVMELCPSNIKFHYVHEPRPGVSCAKNRGIEASSGDAILWTDDDVRVPRDWILEMTRPLLDGTCDAVAGGVILPEKQARAVRAAGMWKLRSWFADTHFLNCDQPTTLVGANMAIARRVFEKIGGFDLALGGGAIGSFEETDLAARLLAAGFFITGRLDVQVEHHFDLARLDQPSLKKFAERWGASRGYYLWHGEGIRLCEPRSLGWLFLFAVPRLLLLPMLLPFWRDARAPWLSLVARWSALMRNRQESRLPRRRLGHPLSLSAANRGKTSDDQSGDVNPGSTASVSPMLT